ncbi:MarR family winged helix-turn-helix transcriptional regulator [Acinetobacter sp. Ver3]|uniref:MarR family winged helix-turn-helix transcriptional regulator n=1 Tax=Acinetobacter sp. Ver3 TaxID=466088 RepID=UPI00044816D8|nr:MarR family transcriptional regulator [Acinetobacter sp. Ver3]EZQ10650.1 hypothetical protein CL42_06685 [Acinetobacter sp. Ver3]
MFKKNTNSPEIFDNESGYLGFLLRKTSHVYRLKMERVLAEYSITPPQFTILKIILTYPGFTNAEIARFASLTPQTVNLMISKLEKQNILYKTSHSTNKKIQLIEISDLGKKLMEDCGDAIDLLEDSLVDGFSESEIRIVRNWMKKINEE